MIVNEKIIKEKKKRKKEKKNKTISFILGDSRNLYEGHGQMISNRDISKVS